jgi:hypothetical protein
MADGVAGGMPPDEKKNGVQPESEQVSGEMPKKQKTDAQIERERERRRRRRKRKKMMTDMLKSSGENILHAGENKLEDKPAPEQEKKPEAMPETEEKTMVREKPVEKPAAKQVSPEPKIERKPDQKPERVREDTHALPRPSRDHHEHEPRKEPAFVRAHKPQADHRGQKLQSPVKENAVVEKTALPSAQVNAETVKRAADADKKKQPVAKAKIEPKKIAKPEAIIEQPVVEPQTLPAKEPERIEDLPPIFPDEGTPEAPEPSEKPDVKVQPESLTYMSHSFEGEDDLVIGEVRKEEEIPVGPLTEEQKPVEKNHEEHEEEEVLEEKPKENEGTDVPSEKPESAELKTEAKPEVKQIHEILQEKKASTQTFFNNLFEILKKATSGMTKLFGALGQALSRLSFLANGKVVAPLIIFVVIAGLGYFGYSQGYYQKAATFVSDFFKQKPVQQVLVGDITADPLEHRQWGLVTANLFGTLRGSLRDKIPSQISMATFFGELMEPGVSGETGISAATYYGEIGDQIKVVNQFVVYVQQLQKMQNLYATDVYEMLDKTTARATALFDYIDKLKTAREDGQRLMADLHINVDDLNVSFSSLNADKSKYETDFFAAMEALEPEKSDALLKGFVDISQKQTALKARISALNKLAGYYDAALKKLDKRIEAVDKNRDALIQGIRVVDIPGGNLDIIIHPVVTK